MSTDIKTAWTKRGESKRGIEPLLLARQINNSWLESSIKTTSVHLSGDLLSSLTDLREAAKAASKKSLPITSLRLMLQASMTGVLNVDRDIGCDPRNPSSAIDLHETQSSDSELCAQVAHLVRMWCMDALEPWAEREQFGGLAVRVKKAAKPENISLATSHKYLRDPHTKKTNFSLITRLIADQLSGEVLFEGMPVCEVVLPESPFSRGIDLMTAPRRPISESGGKNAFSMIARIHVSTVPYNSNVYFSVSCAKRVWAAKMPDGGNTGISATAYVLVPDRPIIPVRVIKKKVDDAWQWDFANEYASLNIEAEGKLPASLLAALQNSVFKQGEWWAGLPQVTRLYRSVDQHTAMESDEVELFKVVLPMLAGIVDGNSPIPIAVERLTLNRKPESTMLKLADVGAAGVSIADTNIDEDTEGDDEDPDEVTDTAERADIAKFREQCVHVLSATYGDGKAGLWIVGGTPQEQDIVEKTASLLFGESVLVSRDPLPQGVHGLKSEMNGKDLKSLSRFNLRVSAWNDSKLPQAIATHPGPKFVLICANREIGRRTEDPVNRRAAIHAICAAANASVHHLLPIEDANTPARVAKAIQTFIHRCQSAMMDVMLAHSGYVIGARDFVAGQISEEYRPKAVYGVQALRTQGQQFTGELPVTMIIYSKLNLETNVTEMNFTFRSSGQTKASGWMALSRALIWLGCVRANDGDDKWLQSEFTRSTIATLSEIQRTDPAAVVLIDWGTVAGLWKDLTDENLRAQNPQIGNLDLKAAFSKMSFARLRYGRDAQIAVRSWSKTMYEGFREEASRESTGTYFEDGYAVTVKQLLAIDPNPEFPHRGHFIGVMGARKTFQLKRGTSCYRFMTRMSAASAKGASKKDKGVFEKRLLPPCDKDATIASSMDITVLCSPNGISPLDIATLAMGLRVGYAHYDDWTMLPAPLFFARKIDDYIIKYPKAEEDVAAEALDLQAPETAAEKDLIDQAAVEPQTTEPDKMRIWRGLIQRELNLEYVEERSAPIPSAALHETALISEALEDEKAQTLLEKKLRLAPGITDADRDLLTQAKNVRIISFYPATDIKRRRIYTAMMRGDIKIQVDVPYFVSLGGFFGFYTPDKKKNVQRSWREIKEIAYVAPTQSRPDFSQYLDWLASKLKHPQGAYLTTPRTLFKRAIIIPEANNILQKYNETAIEKITSFVNENGRIHADFSLIVKKACDENDDWSLAWLVFAAAQTPGFGFAESVIDTIDRIPGPMTFDALMYYVQCATVIKLVFETFTDVSSFKEIHIKREVSKPPVPLAPLLEPETAVASAVKHLTSELMEKGPTESKTMSQASSIQREPELVPIGHPSMSSGFRERFMQFKTQIKSIIDQFEPGSARFADQLAEFHKVLNELVSLDEEIRQAATKRHNLQARLDGIDVEANDILRRIAEVDEDLSIGSFSYVQPETEKIDVAQEQLISVQKAIGKAEESFKQLHDLVTNDVPPGSQKSERIRRAKDISGLSTVVGDELRQVEILMEESIVFTKGGDSTQPPDPTKDAEHTGVSGESVSKAGEVKRPDDIDFQIAVPLAITVRDAPGFVQSPKYIEEAHAKEQAQDVTLVEPKSPEAEINASASEIAANVLAQPMPKNPAPANGAESTQAVTRPAVPATGVATPAIATAKAAFHTAHQSTKDSQPAASKPDIAESAEIDPVKRRAESESAELTIDEHALETATARLKSLMDMRHYGLAGVYIDAIKSSFDIPQVAVDCNILGALAETLDSIDCNFNVDARLNTGLRAMLTQGADATPLRRAGYIGILAAGFMSALFSARQTDGSGDEDALWTVVGFVGQPLIGYPELSRLVEHIGSKENTPIMLTREKFAASAIGNKMDMEAANERARRRAASWNKDPDIYSGFGHHGFTKMHEHIYGTKHPIGLCLSYLAKGDVKNLKRAFQDAQGKFKKPSATTAEVFRALGEKQKPDGHRNVSACSNIASTEKFIRDYLDRFDEGGNKAMNVIPAHEMEYLQSLHTYLRNAITEIDAMPKEPGMTEQIYVQSAKTVFESILRLYDDQAGKTCMPVSQQKLLIQQPMDRLLNPSIHDSDELGARAITTGELVIDTIDILLEEDLSQQPAPIPDDVIIHLLLEAQLEHVAEKRFLPAFLIDAILPKGLAKLEPPLYQQYLAVKADLTRQLQDARQRVTHAMALSALDQKDANQLLRLIESIHASNLAENAIGQPTGSSSAYPDFPHALAALNNQVLDVLDAKLGEAKNKLMTDLGAFEELMGDLFTKDVERIRLMLSKNNPASIRTAHDAFAILRNGGKLPSHALNSSRNVAREFESFVESLSKIRGQQNLLDSLETVLRSEQRQGLPQAIQNLDDVQRAEAAQFIKFWKEICMHRGSDSVAMAADFFTALGIGAPTYVPERTGRQTPTRFEFPQKAFATLTSGDCFVPPALGSMARMVAGYIISGSHPETEIPSLIQDITSPTFILSRAALALSKRAKLINTAPVLLIDDALIAYMALNPEDRARRMMEIVTLTFHTSPYSADGTFVAREMFFGRQREINSLRSVKSVAILYGGRRLGKSSLLAEIEREENSIPGSVGIYIPMDRDYAGGEDHVLYAWKKLYVGLHSRGVIEQQIAAAGSDWRQYRDWVEQQLTAPGQKVKSCYLLFDEADNLMSHELDLAPEKTGFIRSLQQTSEDVRSKSGFNLRYVIAGLHNLARMTTESNSALGKAETIALEPYSSEDDILRGVELVTKPMAGLGFFFPQDSEDLPLRILSICNFYPAFIQIYCRKLLEHMYNKRRKEAYALIEVGDLEAVEKDHDLLHELQLKFSWTLDLDKRYKAIALILADYYYSEIEMGRNEGLTVAEIMMWCEVEVGNHFKGMSSGAYEGLVDEMRKLNVLEKNASRYRLRNPSIAMLIGDRQRIHLQLKALASAPPEKTRNHGDRRNDLIPVGHSHNGEKAPIFPMPIAWTHSQLETIDGNLVIVGGNNLCGLSDATASRSEWLITQNDRFKALPLTASALNTFLVAIRKPSTSSNKEEKQLVMSTSSAWKVNEIPQFATSASRAANNRIRLMLAALPDRLYEIATAIERGMLIQSNDKKTEWSVAPVPPWSIDAVRFYLHDNNAVSEDAEACKAIIEASCGFGKQIQNICAGNLTVESAIGLVKAAEKDFAPNLSVFYDKIGMPGAIPPQVLQGMQEFLVNADKEQRFGSKVDGYLDDFGLKQTDLLFLNWMGLIQDGENNTWVVPKLYRRLLG
jgi:hypothetical protein